MQSQDLAKYILAILFAAVLIMLCAPERALAAPFSITPATGTVLPNGIMSVPYSLTLTEPGLYTGSLHWSVSSTLPDIITISPNNTPTATPAVLSFVPTVSGTYSITVTVTDDRINPAPRSASATYSITIVAECSFVGTSTGSIAFSTIDPSTTPGPITNNSITQQVLFQCNTTVTYSISQNPANPALLFGGNSIPFTLGLAALGQNVTNTTQIPLLTTASSILIAEYQNAPAGLYTNSGIIVTISWTGSSSGTLSATVTASGTVISTCAVMQPAGTLTFAIDPSAALSNGVLTPAGQDLKIKCTKSSPVSASASSKCGGLAQNGSGSCTGFLIPYTFTHVTGATGLGFGGGLDIPMNIGGSATQAGYADAPTGSVYGDIQTLTITY